MSDEVILLRISVYSNEQYNGISLYEQIVLKAKELGMNGATVTKGMMGFIGGDKIHKPKLSRIAENLPVIIEIADTEENTNRLLPFLEEIIAKGLVTSERVKIKLNRMPNK